MKLGVEVEVDNYFVEELDYSRSWIDPRSPDLVVGRCHNVQVGRDCRIDLSSKFGLVFRISCYQVSS